MKDDPDMSAKALSRRLIGLLPAAGALAGALGGVGTASAQHIDSAHAPAAWIAYAQQVSDAVQARLAGDDPVAVRLRTYLNQLPGAGDTDGIALKIAFWIDGRGRITRIDHTPFAHAQPNEDLQALLGGQTMPHAPPKGMLLPLRLSIGVKPKPQVQSSRPAAMTIGVRYRHVPLKPLSWS